MKISFSPGEYGEYVKKRRAERGMTITQLGELAFVTDGVLNEIERGVVNSMHAVKRIEAAFRAAKDAK